MLKLALTVVAIALPDCINPSLIGGALFVATRPRARTGVAAFTLAAGMVTFVFGLVFAFGLGNLILSVVPKPSSMVRNSLITAAGVVMLAGSAVIWIRRRALTAQDPVRDEGNAHRSAALIGAALAGIELLSAFPYFAAIALIVGSGVSLAGKVSLLALYCVIYILPLIAIAVAYAVMGDQAERILRPIGDRLLAHWPIIVAPITACIGIAVLAFGVVQLSSA